MAGDADWLTFVTSDAQVLRFGADQVRPQGAGASGMSGISLNSEAEVICFGTAYSLDHVLVSVSSTAQALSGMGPGRVKLSALSEFPAKGRGTKGVRGHSFLKGEDTLVLAAVAASPRAVSQGGRAVELPTDTSKRDGSGTPLSATIGSVGEAAGLD